MYSADAKWASKAQTKKRGCEVGIIKRNQKSADAKWASEAQTKKRGCEVGI